MILLLTLTWDDSYGIQKPLRKSSASLQAISKLIEEGKLENALAELNKALDAVPNNAEAIYLIGKIFSRLNQNQAAIEYIKSAIQLSPENIKYHTYLAELYELIGSYDDAASEYTLIIELATPGSDQVKLAQKQLKFVSAGKYAKKGEFQSASRLYKELLEEYPNDLKANYSLGVTYLLSNYLTKAETQFKKVLQLKPDHIKAYYSLASLYEKKGDLEQAADMLQEILKLAPEGPSARRTKRLIKVIKGKLLVRKGKLNEAIKLLQQALQEDPGDLKTIFSIARIYRRLGRTEEEARMLEEALKIAPDNLALRKRLGAYYLEHSQFYPARIQFEKIVNAEPLNRLARMSLALAYDNLGLLGKAVNEYATVVSMEDNEAILDTLVSSLLLTNAKRLFVEGRLDLARSAFNDVLRKSPDSATAHLYLGLIYSEESDFIHAAEEYRKVLHIIPSHAGARTQLALTYENLNREEDAIGEYTRIIRDNPSSKLIEIARKRIRFLEKQINGISSAIRYSLNYDSNTNLSDDNPIEDYHFDATLNLAYRYKTQKGIRIQLGAAPVYQTYQKGNFDFLNINTTFSLRIDPRDYSFTMGYTHRINRGLVNSKRFSRADNLFFEGKARKRMRSVIHPFTDRRNMTDISMLLSYTDFDSETSSFFSAMTYTAGLTLKQTLTKGNRVTIGYGYVRNDNKESLGRDYAYQSHGVIIRLQSNFYQRISAGLNYGYTRLMYSKADTFASTGKHRDNRRHTVSLDTAYRLQHNLKLNSGISWTRNNSNLPVGFVLNPQDVIEGQQSTSLGDYERLVITIGMELAF